MRDFIKLEIWQRSHSLTLKIYSITNQLPLDERYGLSSQMRRSASSVPTNIAEGCGRRSLADLKRYLTIASGSLSELHYQIILCHDLGYLAKPPFKELAEEVVQIKKMVYSYSEKLDLPIRALKADS